jgi:hypothetical protein
MARFAAQTSNHDVIDRGVDALRNISRGGRFLQSEDDPQVLISP